MENNFFDVVLDNPEYASSLFDLAKGNVLKKEVDEKVTIEATKYISNHPYEAMKDVVDEVAPHYFSGGLSLYKYNVKFALNLRKGDLFLGGGISHLPVISNSGLSTSLDIGWITNFNTEEKNNLGKSINNVLGGASLGMVGCGFGYCGSINSTIPTPAYPKSYISTGFGIGAGYSLGNDVMFKVTGDK